MHSAPLDTCELTKFLCLLRSLILINLTNFLSLLSLPLPPFWVVVYWKQDYFNVIDTSMDFGTICSNLEHSIKYMNSEDVFNDVQYIWENCCKCNKKGEYIVYLMKRVKKKFMKYWTAAGLSIEQSRKINGMCSQLLLVSYFSGGFVQNLLSVLC